MTKVRHGNWEGSTPKPIRLPVTQQPKPPKSSMTMFIITMIIGVGFAVGLERSGLGFKAGFAFGVAYMLVAALVINSSARR